MNDHKLLGKTENVCSTDAQSSFSCTATLTDKLWLKWHMLTVTLRYGCPPAGHKVCYKSRKFIKLKTYIDPNAIIRLNQREMPDVKNLWYGIPLLLCTRSVFEQFYAWNIIKRFLELLKFTLCTECKVREMWSDICLMARHLTCPDSTSMIGPNVSDIYVMFNVCYLAQYWLCTHEPRR